MLAAALEEEVSAFLGRHRYERGKGFRCYSNGYHPAREVTVGLSPVGVRVPRVTKVLREVALTGVQWHLACVIVMSYATPTRHPERTW